MNLPAPLLRSSFFSYSFTVTRCASPPLFPAQILKRGCGVNDRDGLTDMSLLHYCCKAGAQGIGQRSRLKAISSGASSVLHRTPAFFPRCLGDPAAAADFARRLLALGADPNLRSRWTNMRALHYAAYFDVPQLIRVVMQASQPGGERMPSARVVRRRRRRKPFCTETVQFS